MLIGENGSGKSSFVQALALLKQSLGSGSLVLSGPLMDLGQFANVVHQPTEPSDEMEFGIAGVTYYAKPIELGDARSDGVEFRYSWATNDGNAARMSALHRVGESFKLEARWNRLTGGSVLPPSVLISGITYGLGAATGVGQGVVIGGSSTAPGVDEAAMRLANDAVNNVVGAPAAALRRAFFVPAMRGIERQSYDLGDQASSDLVSPDGSLRVSQALATTLAYQRELEATIALWMERVTNRGIQVRLTPPRRVSVNALAQGIAVNIANEGFGSNQLSHVLAVLALLPNDALIAIEEPEIHLHPAAQTSLVNVLLEVTRAKKSQLLMTTHSEHVLYALMALVGEGTLKPEDIAIHHVAIDQGQTIAKRLDVDSSGRIKGGLPGFFNVHVQEFRRFLEAAEKKQ